MNVQYDVAIVGASVAGSSLAIELGREGFSVLLADRERFPRAKACGESVAPVGVAQLDRLGVLSSLHAGSHSTLSHYLVRHGSRRMLVPMGSPDTKGLGIARELLDWALASRACASPGVRGAFGHMVRKVTPVGTGFALELEEREILCRYLVLAEGAHSFLAPRLGVPAQRNRSERYGLSHKAIVSAGALADRATVLLRDGYEVFLTPLGARHCNISVVGDRLSIRKLSRDNSWQSLADWVSTELGIDIVPCGERLAFGPFQSVRRPGAHGKILLVGDSCENFDPIGGMGISHALLSSALAGETLTRALHVPSTQREAFARYAARRAHLARPMRGFTRLTYFALRGLAQGSPAGRMLKLPLAHSLGEGLYAAVHGGGARSVWVELSKAALGLVGRF